MRTTAWLFVSALLAGCSALSGNGDKLTQIETDIEKSKLQYATRDDLYKAAILELKKAYDDLSSKLTRLEHTNIVMQSMLDRMGNQRTSPAMDPGPSEVVTVKSSPPPPKSPTPAVNPTKPPTPAPVVETKASEPFKPAPPAAKPDAVVPKLTADKAARLTEIASILKDPKFTGTDAIKKELATMPVEATSFLLDEVIRDIREIEFAQRVEELIAGLPVDATRAPLEKALKNPDLRLTAVRIIGRIADPSWAEALRAEIANPDEVTQVSVGVALVRSKDKAGIPLLLKTLGSNDWANRMMAINTLRRLNRREDYTYSPFKSPQENAAALKKWDEWWDTFKDADLLN